MRTRILVLLSLCVAMAAFSGPTAAQTVFTGSDPGAGPGGARPNSDAARDQFLLALAARGSAQRFDFETAPLGPFTSLDIGLATVTWTGMDPAAGVATGGTTTLGYNTTQGGSRYLDVVPLFADGSAVTTVTFKAPTQAFGSYVTGLGTASGSLYVQFNDGSSQRFPIVGNALGGVIFFGIVDADKAIASVEYRLEGVTTSSRDIYGIDDFVSLTTSSSAEVIPALGGFGLVGLIALVAAAGVYLLVGKFGGRT